MPNNLKENQLIVEDRNGKIYLEWHVNHRSNFDTYWDWLDDGRSIDFSNEDAIWDIFDLGLVIETLVRNIEHKTPEEYKKYFYNEETLKTEDSKYPKENRYLNRLKIFERNGWEKEIKERFRKAKHMDDFYSLWKSKKFGNWEWNFVIEQKEWDGMPPFKIFFEWEYPDYFIFDRFIPYMDEEDLYYLCTEFTEEGVGAYSKFNYFNEYDLESYINDSKALEKRQAINELQEKIEKKIEKTVTDEIKAKTKAQEEEWFERQKNQKDLF
jgi:hypothetical protein